MCGPARTFASQRSNTVAAALLAALLPTAAFSQCTPQWFPGDGRPGANDDVYALIVFDLDGPGPTPPELIAGGYFDWVGDVRARGVARWDGTRWRPLSDQIVDVAGFAIHDPDGPGPLPPQLIAAGGITTTPGTYPHGVIRWTGSAWELVGDSPPFFVDAVASFDSDGPGPLPPRIFAAGSDALNSPYHAIAQWDGANWLPLGSGLGDPLGPGASSLTVFDPDGPGPAPAQLIVGGQFQTAGGLPAVSIASWDGLAWNALESGVTYPGGSIGYVHAMTTFALSAAMPPELIVGGRFQLAGNVPARSIAAWNGSTWRSLGGLSAGGTTEGWAQGLASYDPDGPGPLPARLIVAGWFTTAGTTPVANIAQYDAGAWSPLGSGFDHAYGSTAFPLAAFDPAGTGAHLIVLGGAGNAGGVPVNLLAAWDGQSWHSTSRGFNDEVFALTTFDPDGPGPAPREIIAGGPFLTAGDASVTHIARFDGLSWRPLGQGVTPSYAPVQALATFDPDGEGPLTELLAVGGRFTSAGGIPVRGIATWDGSAWHALGSPPNQWDVSALTVFDFDGTGPDPPRLVAAVNSWPAAVQVWDGTDWHQLGDGFDITGPNDSPELLALAVFDPDGPGPLPAQLYAAGHFTRIGSTTIRTVARWDGSAWVATSPPNTVYDFCYAMASFDPDGPGPLPPTLIVAINNTLYSWDGTTWHTFGSPPRSPRAITVFDPDGTQGSPLLIVGGFDLSSQPVLAAWNGSSWQLLDIRGHYPPTSTINALLAWDAGTAAHSSPQLAIGGQFDAAGDLASSFFARWGCPTPAPCYANCDNSITAPLLTPNDFACFLSRFASGDPYANCDGSTTPPTLNVLDFSCFLNAFAAGCP